MVSDYQMSLMKIVYVFGLFSVLILINQYYTVWRLENVQPECVNSPICNPVNGYSLPTGFDCRSLPCKYKKDLFYEVGEGELVCTWLKCVYRFSPYRERYIDSSPSYEPSFWRSFLYGITH